MKIGDQMQHVARSLALIFALFSSATLAASSGVQGKIFGTSYTVKVRSDGLDIDELDAMIRTRLEEIDQRMSTWRENSEISRFNQAGANVWTPVHAETASVVQLSKAISVETEGAFDVTVGPLVGLWNFGPGDRSQFKRPTDELVAATLSRVGHENLKVQLNPPALHKTVAGLEVDLSAVAKGYAVDQIGELLDKAEISNYMVEIGGEVRVRGTNDDGTAWRIGLESPERDARRVASIVSLRDQSLATSGDYRNYFEHDGVFFSHTIDPRTGRPVSHTLASVTVVAKDCARADALATALLVMGPEAGLAWAEQHSVQALLGTRSQDGMVSQASTASFPAFGEVNEAVTNSSTKSATSQFFSLFVATAIVFGIAIVAMSIGTIVANRRLQGSCGGMAGMSDAEGKTICDMCTRPSKECTGDPDADIADAASRT